MDYLAEIYKRFWISRVPNVFIMSKSIKNISFLLRYDPFALARWMAIEIELFGYCAEN